HRGRVRPSTSPFALSPGCLTWTRRTAASGPAGGWPLRSRLQPNIAGRRRKEKLLILVIMTVFLGYSAEVGMPRLPSLSTDQVAAFVELARQGSLRRAAGELHLTEQGLRNRLLALESRLGVELYRKQRGPRRGGFLTDAGRRFLPHAVAFLER